MLLEKDLDIVPNHFGMINCFTYGKNCEAESNFLSSQQNSRARRALLATFKQEQNTFGKSYHRAKSTFEHDKRINIERLNTEIKWKSQFHKLFQGYNQNEFDKDFYDFAINEKKRLGNRLKCKYRYL